MDAVILALANDAARMLKGNPTEGVYTMYVSTTDIEGQGT